MTTNLFDYFEEVAGLEGAHAPWAARAPRRPNEHFDIKLVPRSPAWEDDVGSLEVLVQIEREPWVEG